MIHVVLYSENRAAQCDVALESILSRLTASTAIHITVLYSASSDEFRRGYEILRNSYSSHVVNFVENRTHPVSHRTQATSISLVRALLTRHTHRNTDIVMGIRSILEQTVSGCTLFMNDEDILLSDTYISPEMYTVVASGKGINAVHLRLGLNIRNKPTHIRDQTRYCTWNPQHAQRDWAKRFSVDGSLVNTTSFLRILRSVLASSLLEMERAINQSIRKDTFASTLYSFHRQRVVKAEIDDYRCLTASEINNEYVIGKRLALSLPIGLATTHIELHQITLSDSTSQCSTVRESTHSATLVKKQEYHLAGSHSHVHES